MNDLKYAVRMLLKKPVLTVVAISSLALGIGANTTIFSIINAALLRPLPFKDPNRLMIVETTGFGDAMSGGDFRDVREQAKTLSQVTAYATVDMNLSGDGEPERIRTARVSSSFCDTLGVAPALGRSFLEAENKAGAEKVVFLGQRLWQRRFGADPSVIGRVIKLDAQSYTVVGVLPTGFDFPEKTETWIPLGLSVAELNDYGSYFLRIIGRLKPEANIARAHAELAAIGGRSKARYPDFRKDWQFHTTPLHEHLVGYSRTMLLVLAGAVGFVLCIACANVANLLLALAAERRKEMGIRLALGAGRGRLIRQLLTESLLLAGLGGVAGLLLSGWGMDLLNAWLPGSVPRIGKISLDATVLFFTAAVSVLAGLIFGLASAFQINSLSLNESVKQGTRSATEGGGSRRLRSALVVSETALAIILLTGAGLLIKSFWMLEKVRPGFRADHVLTARVELPETKYASAQQRLNYQRQLSEKIQALPGVQSAGVISRLPLSGGNVGYLIEVEGRGTPKPGPFGPDTPAAGFRSVTADYFRAMGIPLLQGRTLGESDNENSRQVAVINETMAKKFWPNENPIGKRIKPSVNNGSWIEVVGVVGGVRHQSLDREPDPEMFVPFAQNPDASLNLVLRTISDPVTLAVSVRGVISSLDKDQPVYDVRTMEERVGESVAEPRFRTSLLALFGMVALVLAAVGIYGVMSCSVAQRTREIGVRMALGAQPGDVLKLVVRQGMKTTLLGLAIGLAGAFALTRVLASQLYEVRATDPTAFACVALLLAVVALVACWLPSASGGES